jgi:hypothetical protein
VNTFRARLETPSGAEWVRRGAWAVLALAFVGFLVRGGSTPDDPYLAVGDRRPLEGFGEITFSVTDPRGAMATWCALLADTDSTRAQGLMHQDDLRGYDGMVFQYGQPTDGAFWMKNTTIPLAVAFFDGDGRFINAQGMDPCPEELDDCPRYPAAAPFTFAIEAERGGLGALGIGPGSQVTFPGTPCP